MSVRVWVIATEETTARWAEALREAGHEVVALPWSRVRPLLDASRTARLRLERRPDVLLLTSANAVLALPEGVQWPVPVACVGEATAEAARARGLDVFLVGASGAAALARELAASRPGAHVLYLRARDARREGVDVLEALGLTVDEVVTYEVLPRSDFALRLAEAPKPEALVVGSPRSAEALKGALCPRDLAAHRARPVVAVGETTAGRLADLGFARVQAAARPGVEGILEALAALR